jgi:hypothetical protein
VGDNDCITVLYEDRLSYGCITVGYYNQQQSEIAEVLGALATSLIYLSESIGSMRSLADHMLHLANNKVRTIGRLD